MMVGSASGSSTDVSSRTRPNPMPLAASTTSSGTPSRPDQQASYENHQRVEHQADAYGVLGEPRPRNQHREQRQRRNRVRRAGHGNARSHGRPANAVPAARGPAPARTPSTPTRSSARHDARQRRGCRNDGWTGIHRRSRCCVRGNRQRGGPRVGRYPVPDDPIRQGPQGVRRRHGRRRGTVPRRPARRAGRPGRALRLRQDHVDEDGQPADRTDVGADLRRRQGHPQRGPDPAAPPHRLRHPEHRPVPAPHHQRERRHRPRAARLGQDPQPGQGRRAARAGRARPGEVRTALPARALRRPASARGSGSCTAPPTRPYS